MNPTSEHPWPPTPELLAAYFDGEFEGRDELAEYKDRLEAWLSDNPQAQVDLSGYRQLRYLWQTTTPAPPSKETWQQELDRLVEQRWRLLPSTHGRPLRTPRRSLAWAVPLCLLFGWIGWNMLPSTPLEEVEIFSVAAEDEVTIVRVDGEDMQTLVVGLLPVQGLLELAEPGEVRIAPTTAVEFDALSTPVIWARNDDE